MKIYNLVQINDGMVTSISSYEMRQHAEEAMKKEVIGWKKGDIRFVDRRYIKVEDCLKSGFAFWGEDGFQVVASDLINGRLEW